MKIACAVALGAVLLLPLSASSAGSSDRVVVEARSAAASAASLRAITVEEDDSTDVPLAARSGLRVLKTHLSDFVGATLACSDTEDSSPERITEVLSDGLRSEGLVVWASSPGADPDGAPYGDVVRLEAERPAGAPDLLAVTAQLGIPYGSDGVLWLFERRDGAWRRILTVSSDDYESISGARGSFRAVVALDGSGRPVVLTGDVSPWCSSNWQRFRVEVLRPGAAPERPRRLLSVERSVFLGGSDDPFSLALSGDSFRVEFDAEQSLDDGRLVRGHLIVGRVTADGVELASPVAEDRSVSSTSGWARRGRNRGPGARRPARTSPRRGGSGTRGSRRATSSPS